jgi:hypothetical protein
VHLCCLPCLGYQVRDISSNQAWQDALHLSVPVLAVMDAQGQEVKSCRASKGACCRPTCLSTDGHDVGSGMQKDWGRAGCCQSCLK